MHKKQKGSKNTALASSCTCSRRRRWWNKKSKNVALPRPHYEGITGGSCGGWWPLQGKYEKSSARNSGAGFCTPPCLPEKAFEYRRRVLRRAVHFLHAGTWLQCTLPCTLCLEYNEKGGFLLFDLAPVKVFSFSPARGLHFCIRRLFHTFFFFFFLITSPYVYTSVIKVSISIGCKQH